MKACAASLILRVNKCDNTVTIDTIISRCVENSDISIVTNSTADFEDWLINNKINTVYMQDFNVEGHAIIYFGMLFCSLSNVLDIKGHLYQINLKLFNNHTIKYIGVRNLFRCDINELRKSFTDYKNHIDNNAVQLYDDEKLSDAIIDDRLIYCDILVKAIYAWRIKKFTKLTIGSEALKQWQNSFNEWEDYFEDKITLSADKELRSAYRGGLVYLNKQIIGKDICKGIDLDINSLYPYIMMEKLLPYGEPIVKDYEKYGISFDFNSRPIDYPLAIFKIRITCKIKDKHIPCISCMETDQYADSFHLNEYLDSIMDKEIWVTDTDLELIRSQYKLYDLTLLKAYYFRAKKGEYYFKSYIDYWYDKKQCTKDGERDICKLMLNSLSGKFGLKDGSRAVYRFTEDEMIDRISIPGNSAGQFRYIAMIIFITSYGRDIITRLGEKYYDRLLYIDTDGMHLSDLDIPSEFDIGTHMGQFKQRYFKRVRYIAPKTYLMETDSGEFKAVMSGAPETVKSKINWDNFRDNTVIPKAKPIVKHVKGGAYREYVDYTLSLSM